jgi:RNA polymerase sigma-70 factor (ECF subfamily)
MEPSLRARVRVGDPAAFGVLFDEYSRAVYNLAFRLTGNWSTAEEAVSLTFLEAWRLRASVEPDGESLRPWLLGITINVNRNMSRAARRHQAALSRLPPPPPVPDFADEVAGQLDDARQLRKVLAAVGRLRPDERDVIALCVWSELDYAAAARALGIPTGTVRSRLSRARKKLRKLAADVTEPAGPDREPRAGCEQVKGDRDLAARSMQEGIR